MLIAGWQGCYMPTLIKPACTGTRASRPTFWKITEKLVVQTGQVKNLTFKICLLHSNIVFYWPSYPKERFSGK